MSLPIEPRRSEPLPPSLHGHLPFVPASNPSSEQDLKHGALPPVPVPGRIWPKIERPVAPSESIVTQERNARAISERCALHPTLACLLAVRGFTPDSAEKFLTPATGPLLPPVSELLNLDKATAMLATAVRQRKTIGIACDYDVDGTCSGAILAKALEALGAKVVLVSPQRFKQGYGLHEGLVRELHKAGADTLVTLDFGTANDRELGIAKRLGMKTIVVDHHQVVDTTPGNADAFMNPHQAGCGYAGGQLCTGGLAWVLASNLVQTFRDGGNKRLKARADKIDMEPLLAYTALATVCDVMKLTDANRELVRRGLAQLAATKDAGLLALQQSAGLPKGRVFSDDLGFKLGPRINAASRMLDAEKGNITGSRQVLELFTTRDPARAEELAALLNRCNIDRKKVEHRMVADVKAKLEKEGEIPAGIVVWDAGFHEGLNGIVAARLADLYKRPAAVLGVNASGRLVGSIRSVEGVDVLAVLQSGRDMLEKFGGHAAAAGLTLKPRAVSDFKAHFATECQRAMAALDTTPRVRPDAVASLVDIQADAKGFTADLARLEPFGNGNRLPRLLVEGAQVVSVVPEAENHLKVMLRQGTSYTTCFLWREKSHPALVAGQMVDVVLSPMADRRPTYDPRSSALRFEILAAERACGA